MPSFEPPADQFLLNTIASHEAQLRALAAQQQSTITDELGRPVLNIGLIPGSNPAQYGLQFLDPATNTPRMFIGSTAAGAVVQFFDSTGAPVVELGPDGLKVLDDSGVTQVAAGLLNASPAMYGLAVLPAGASSGTPLQRVGGKVASTGTGGTTTSAIAVTLGTGPSVTVPLGPSGQALVIVSSYVGIGTNGAGYVELLVNGTSVNTEALYVATSGSGTAGDYSMPYLLSEAPNSTVTITLKFWTNGVSTTFGNPSLTVTPL